MYNDIDWTLAKNLDCNKHFHVLPEYRALYLVNQKCCSRTIRIIFGNEPVFKRRGYWGERPTWRLKFPNKYKDFFKFTFVRNPWDRLVSFFHFKNIPRIQGTSFPKETLSTIGLQPRCDWNSFINAVYRSKDENVNLNFRSQFTLFPLDLDIPADFVGSFENFNNDWHVLVELKNFPNLLHNGQCVWANKSQHKSYQEYYTKEQRDMIYERYKVDINMFGFTFD
jgi:hypothetical protein